MQILPNHIHRRVKEILELPGSEHKPGTCQENFSAIKQHVETTTHAIHPNNVEIKEKGVNNLRQCQLLESWHFEVDKNSINEKKEFARVYKAFVKQNA